MPLWIRILVTLLLAVVIFGNWGASTAESGAQQFRDSYGDPAAALSSREAGSLLLRLVNSERAKHGLIQLALSASASKLARQHADDMAAHGYVGHYDLEGRKCELRYNLFGETDHVAENIAYREVGARARLTPELVRSIFADWMGSKSHRRNIHDPAHTHMGYAFATQTTETLTKVYAVQEFVNDWGVYSALPSTARPGDKVWLEGSLTPDCHITHIGIGWEAPPGDRDPQSVGEADLHYRQPEVRERLGKLFSGPLRLTPHSFAGSVELPAVDTPTDVYITVWALAPVPEMALRSPVRMMTQVIRVEPE